MALVSDDGYIKESGDSWTFGTGLVERTVAFEGGALLLKSFRSKLSGRELARPSGELEPGGWSLVGAQSAKLKQGELRLDITVARGSARMTKSYVVHPGSSVIREWATIKNVGAAPLEIIDPDFLELTANLGDLASLDFNWMTGGAYMPATWKLVTESFTAGQTRAFDSAEPFPTQVFTEADWESVFPGRGVEARILHNGVPVWPREGWAYAKNGTVQVPFDLEIEVKAGDALAFVLRGIGENSGGLKDATCFDPSIVHGDGESHRASREFGPEQGRNAWRYQYVEGGEFKDLVSRPTTYPGMPQWREPGAADKVSGLSFPGVCITGPLFNHTDPGWLVPAPGRDAALVWTAAKDGAVRVSGEVWNNGNGFRHAWKSWKYYEDRPGTENYAPWYALNNRDTHEGLIVGWDYFGHWKSSFAPTSSGDLRLRLQVAGHRQSLAPGESVETPKAFTGLYRGDLDDAGNECLNWQYRYLWDYTREGWFPAIRMLGFWHKGVDKSGSWLGRTSDFQNSFRKVFRTADLMRQVGGDVYHRDWGWWDKAGDWNGPDFRSTHDYLAKHGMRQLIYAFVYLADKDSAVAKEHPDWLLEHPEHGFAGHVLDMAKPEVVAFMKGVLDRFATDWGAFEWRNDDKHQIVSSDDPASTKLAQDQGFRQVIREFLDEHPDCAFQSVNGGGYYGGYDYTRYSSSFSFSDGAVGILRNHYASLMLPPDKTSDIPDRYNPDNFDKTTWRGLLCLNFDLTGDTWNPEKLEGARSLIDLYHYLHQQGVVGRWVQVYRPFVDGDDPTMYFQRLSRDHQRGVIIPKRPAPGPVTIRPKGLLPDGDYLVSFQESEAMGTRRGGELMENGIRLARMIPGELIYLNLPLHPGGKLDKEPPSAPPSAVKRLADNMGYPGVELEWAPGADNNWVSYYEVFRGGEALAKVAKGNYYFDHLAGADLAADYEVRTVDGSGNVSPKTRASGPAAVPSLIVDDAALDYSGVWTHETGVFPAHDGTLSWSEDEGASVELVVEGERALWFSKLGPDCGKAVVSLDGAAPEEVDTCAADDIFGVCVHQRPLAPGRHVLRITVLGDQRRVYVDGFRVER